MAVGRQPDTIIVRWVPGESTGVDGSGVTSASPPSDAATVAASGAYDFLDARVDTVNTRVSTLSTRIVASGVLPTGV